MVEFDLKVHPKQRTMYIPKELVKIIGTEPTAIPNAFTILLFKKDEDIQKVIGSLEIILQDLKFQQKVTTEEAVEAM